jgi:hypothetical protein
MTYTKRREDNIKKELKYMASKVVAWTFISKNKVWWRILVKTTNQISYSINGKLFIDYLTNIGFWSGTQLHRVY